MYVDELGRRRAGAEQLAGPARLERVHVFLGNDSAAGDEDVVASLLAQQIEHARNERHVRAAQDREADDVDVFLHRGGRDHLRRLVQPGVDDFHAGIAQRGRDDFRAAVVTVEARLCNEHADRAHRYD